MIETERRFLLAYFPDHLEEKEHFVIEDYMVLTGEDHPHLRLRRKGDYFELCKKYPRLDGSLQMVEETIVLNEQEYVALRQCKMTGQKKTRYVFAYEHIHAEVDVWMDVLEGLAIVEFEFDSAEEANRFEPPDFCFLEVTNEEWLAGGKLSGKSYDDIKDKLVDLGYKEPDKVQLKLKE